MANVEKKSMRIQRDSRENLFGLSLASAQRPKGMQVFKVRSCRYCGLSTHTTMGCFARPRNRTLSRKTIRRIGKYGRKWLKTRAEWIKQNPGPWNCYICGELLTLETLTLDHKKSRSRHPELRYDHANLAPCCWRDNQEKGSKDYEETT